MVGNFSAKTSFFLILFPGKKSLCLKQGDFLLTKLMNFLFVQLFVMKQPIFQKRSRLVSLFATAWKNFVEILPCKKGLSSQELLKYVKDVLMRCHMDPEKTVGTSFDGASPMTNLPKLIKSELAPQALYVHCLAHCNELVFKDPKAISPMIACAQDLCKDLYVLVGISPKTILIFEDIQKYIMRMHQS